MPPRGRCAKRFSSDGAQLQAVVAVVAGQAAFAALQPEMLEARGPVVLAGDAEGMDVVLADVAPVLEADAELEGALRGGHELLLVDLQQAVEGHQRRDGRFADAHGADLVGFDQRDVEQLAQRLRQRRGHHPAGGAAAGDDHAADRPPCGIVHGSRIVASRPHRFRRCSRCARSSRTACRIERRRARAARVSGMCAAVSSSALEHVMAEQVFPGRALLRRQVAHGHHREHQRAHRRVHVRRRLAPPVVDQHVEGVERLDVVPPHARE